MADYAGFFNDGKSAARREVRVRLTDIGLEIADERGAALALWRYADLRLVEKVFSDHPVRLTSAGAGAARLTVGDREFLAHVGLAAPHLVRSRLLQARTWRRFAGWGSAIVALVVAVFLAVTELLPLTASLVPVRWEQAIGERASRDLIRIFAAAHNQTGRVCAQARGQAALRRLTERLAATVDTRYTFNVSAVDLPVVNAVAAPGGYIVLFSGLLDVVESSDEVAGVLAHEMAHVIKRHPTRAVIREAGLSILADVLVGDSTSAWIVAGVGEVLVTLSYSRQDETEADETALSMLRTANIRADGLARFLDRLAKTEGDLSGPLAFLSGHPPSEARARAARTAAVRGRPAMSDGDWAALTAICQA